MTRQKYLLAIVMCLVVAQFLIVPSFSFIDEQREIVSAKNSKKEKENALLLLAEPLRKQMVEVDSSLAALNKFTYSTQSIDSGVLEVQKLIEEVAKKNNVKVNRINWLDPEEIDGEGHAIQIAIIATPADWMVLQSQLEAEDWLVLKKMTFLNRRSSSDIKLIGEISGVLIYKVNFSVVSDGEI